MKRFLSFLSFLDDHRMHILIPTIAIIAIVKHFNSKGSASPPPAPKPVYVVLEEGLPPLFVDRLTARSRRDGAPSHWHFVSPGGELPGAPSVFVSAAPVDGPGRAKARHAGGGQVVVDADDLERAGDRVPQPYGLLDLADGTIEAVREVSLERHRRP